MSAPSYATEVWSPSLLASLRADGDDAYPRPMIQEYAADDAHDEEQCVMCTSPRSGPDAARWVPNDGGAWVFSSSWRAAGGDRADYDRRADEIWAGR